MQRLTFLLLLILLLAAPAVSRAADPALPQADPPDEWRVMTSDAATTSSRCVGQTKTVSCSIDTLYACKLRGMEKLCATAYHPGTFPPPYNYRPHGADEYVIYRVAGAVRYQGGDPLAAIGQLTNNLEIRLGRHNIRKNDILVAVFFDFCSKPDRQDCLAEVERYIRDEDMPPGIFVYRYLPGHGWRYATGDVPRW